LTVVVLCGTLGRFLASKKSANRAKDRGIISALEDTLIAIAESRTK